MMRLRMKLRLGLVAVMAVVCVVMGIYLFILPRLLPTGYEEIARLRQADLKAEGEETPSAPLPSQDGGATHGRENRIVPGGRALPSPARGETPRERFQRCWAAVMNYGDAQWSLAHKQAYVSFYRLSNDDREVPRTVITALILPDEWAALGKLTRGSKPYNQALRRIAEQRLDLKFALAQPQYTSSSQRLAPGNRTARLADVTGTPPLPEAAELLRLPAGTIPSLPEDKMDYPPTEKLYPVLGQAWLYGLAHDPAFDAAAGLRRIHALLQYMEAAIYPGTLPTEEESRIHNLILHTLAASTPGDSRRLAALAGELTRLKSEERAWHATIAEKMSRYQAERIHTLFSQAYEEALQGRLNNGNTFHYMLNGRIERLWLRINAKNIQRHIELYAVAVARGDVAEKQTARNALRRVLRSVNMPDGRNEDYGLASMKAETQSRWAAPELAEDIALLAFKAFWLDKHQYPDSMEELIPDYLPAAALEDEDTALWLAKVDGRAVFVRAAVETIPVPDIFQKTARAPKEFREAYLRDYEEAVKRGHAPDHQPPSDAKIEEVWRNLQKEPVVHVIQGTGWALEFTTHY